MAPVTTTRRLPSDLVDTCVDHLHRQGYRRAVTSAIGEADTSAFLSSGFVVRERLHLLRHDLRGLPRDLMGGLDTDGSIRRVRNRDYPAVLELDRQAFDDFWQLDRDGMAEALSATPSSRFRVIGRTPVGYAIFGRAGNRGYLQRLAVHPEAQGRGIGTALVNDGLTWLRRRAVGAVFVNTQRNNTTALELYSRLGFVHEPDGLVVLEIELNDSDQVGAP